MNEILKIVENDFQSLKNMNLKMKIDSDGLYYSDKINSDNLYIESLQIIKSERNEYWISYNAIILEQMIKRLLGIFQPILGKNDKVKEFKDYENNETIYSQYLNEMERLDVIKYEDVLMISLTRFE